MSTSSRNVRPRRFDGAVVSGRGWVSFRHPFGAKGFPALGLALFFLLCGCRTPAPSTSRRARDVPAEALAAYSQGLQRDFVGDPKGALGFYLQALEAHPSGSPAYLRALAAHGELRRGIRSPACSTRFLTWPPGILARWNRGDG